MSFFGGVYDKILGAFNDSNLRLYFISITSSKIKYKILINKFEEEELEKYKTKEQGHEDVFLVNILLKKVRIMR